jgi:hypothetical protein
MELAVGTSAADVPMNLKNNKILQNVQVAIWCNALSWSAQASVLGKLDVLRNCFGSARAGCYFVQTKVEYAWCGWSAWCALCAWCAWCASRVRKC